MRFIRFTAAGVLGVAVSTAKGYRGFVATDEMYPGDLTPAQIANASLSSLYDKLAQGRAIDTKRISYLPPLASPPKIICVGLNYVDHSAEVGFKRPDHPVVFARYESSLIGHDAPLIRPAASVQFDYEGELAVLLGKGGRYIAESDALSHVLGYSIFNDASVRDFQLRTPQWTIGKNFDGTGPFGPELVTSDELPSGCVGLKIETRLNGTVVQKASIDDLIFSVATLISDLSQSMTLNAGDVIVSGTPAGVGAGRKPPLWMKSGDVCEVEIERIGILRNVVADERPSTQA